MTFSPSRETLSLPLWEKNCKLVAQRKIQDVLIEVQKVFSLKKITRFSSCRKTFFLWQSGWSSKSRTKDLLSERRVSRYHKHFSFYLSPQGFLKVVAMVFPQKRIKNLKMAQKESQRYLSFSSSSYLSFTLSLSPAGFKH